MAGVAIIEALGLVGTGLGIIQFAMDNLAPNAKDPQGTIVAIKGGSGADKGASNTLVSTRVVPLELDAWVAGS